MSKEEIDLDEEQIQLARDLSAEIKSMITREVNAVLDDFLKREQSEIMELFAKVKEEEAERINLILEGVKSHTDRITSLECAMVWKQDSGEDM
jgi:gas vesicle protein